MNSRGGEPPKLARKDSAKAKRLYPSERSDDWLRQTHLLTHQHDRSVHTAAATRQRLGVSWRAICEVSIFPATLPQRHRTDYGEKYSIRATVVGPSGQSAEVVSVWVIRTGEDIPRFVTAYPEGLISQSLLR